MPLPLKGVRVLEMGQLLAVPYLIRLLADMGAEVIKVESCVRLDPHRTSVFYDNTPGEAFWDRTANYNDQNRNKLGITLDLTKPEGGRLFRSLVAVSDLFCENFTPRVMRNFRMEYQDLRRIRPDLIMLSSTGYGYTGPWSNYGAVGPTIEAASGLAHVSGYPGEPPIMPEIPYPDFVAAEHGLFAVMAALHYRARTGRGQFLDLSQLQCQIAIAPEPVLDFLANGRESPPLGGNRHPFLAPHGVYPCLPEAVPGGRGQIDRWIAIAVGADEEWWGLRRVMGDPAWAGERQFADSLSRWNHRQALDEHLGAWTQEQEALELMHRLQQAGVPAGVAFTNSDLLFDPHLRRRGFFVPVPHQEGTGIPVLPYPGRPWGLPGSPPAPADPAPALGQHNRQVIAELLGWPEQALVMLEQEGVIGWKPVSFPTPRPVSLDTLLEQRRIAAYEPGFKERVRVASTAARSPSAPRRPPGRGRPPGR
ncbi:MAG: CoA transferase [Chloroflexi bacterium]|nr:CoA transferase [Chloroflexota bacterium]